MSGLYIHIPYCHRKCIYCDFYSVGSLRAPWTDLVNALHNEARQRLDEVRDSIVTVYIGGGTPSQMPLEQMHTLLNGLRNIYGDRFTPVELTIEANPEDITPDWVNAICEMGVNRLSIGIQSLHDTELTAVGRRHTALKAVEALKYAMSVIPNISVDLMFGLPGQTLDSWSETIESLLQLRPVHLSAYALMREPGTPLDIMLRQKRIKTPTDAETAEMYRFLSDRVKESGYHHYEISNYALPGYESKHNSSYWHSVPYIGLGPSAHSYDGRRTRRANDPDVKSYISQEGIGISHETERLSDAELVEEFVMTRLRTYNGIILSEAAERLGTPAAEKIEMRCRQYLQSQGDRRLLEQTTEGYRLANEGIMLSDMVITAIGFRD